jgi:hypothetical protein
LTKRAGKLDSGAEGWRLMMVQKEIEVFEPEKSSSPQGHREHGGYSIK